MICINIEEQKNWLNSNLETVLLAEDKNSKSLIEEFTANSKGKSLEEYLKKYAWDEDGGGSTKIYLVKDKNTGVIVFFFGLKTGLLYQDIGMDGYNLSEQEEEIVKLCVEYRMDSNSEITVDEVFGWYEDTPNVTVNRNKLEKIIDERVNVKLAAKDDKEKTAEEINIKRVSATFPGIVLTHFCKNESYKMPENLSLPLGFFVFWEIIVDKVLYLASMLGCQYLYLFAADTTSKLSTELENPAYLYADLDEEEVCQEYRLVDYYKNECKFEDTQQISFLKPYYDFDCFSLLQRISMLKENRKAAWIQHSDIEEN